MPNARDVRTVLVVGDFTWDQYEPSFCRGLRKAGVRVDEFRPAGLRPSGGRLQRAQAKWVVGPAIWAANTALQARCERTRPDLVLAWRTPWLRPRIVRSIRAGGSRVVVYNNDDPFGPDRNRRIWKAFRELIPVVDACFSYRQVNVPEYDAAGAKRTFILRSWFDADVHRPIVLTDADRRRYESDVTFVGHWEDDGREVYVDGLVKAGLRVRIFGGGREWGSVAERLGWTGIGEIRPALGDDYARAISAAKLALVFLSRRNRDDYTRRCFEIPAIGTAMLLPLNATLSAMYSAGTEALFYESPRNLCEIARRYVVDHEGRARIAKAGQLRCFRDGHDVDSRAKAFLEQVGSLAPTSS